MKYKLGNIENLDALTLKKQIVEQGAKFIIFKYKISIIALSFDRLSIAYCVRNKEEFKQLKQKYNFRTMLLGLWAFPWGPFETYSTIKLNNNGGIDVTQDVLLNIETYNKEDKSIFIEKMYTQFSPVSKHDLKEVKKAFAAYYKQSREIEALYIGKYINIEEGLEPPYMVGIKSKVAKPEIKEKLEELFYQKFYSFAQVFFFFESENEELFEKIKEQGQYIRYNSFKES